MNSKDLSKMFPELEKKYKGNLTLTVASESPKVEIIGSTGSFLLDSALECGGIPAGRIVEYWGQASGGKCVSKDTYILTANEGYKTIEEIFNSNGVVPSMSIKEVEKSYNLINGSGKSELTTHFTCNNTRPVFKVKTKSGFEIKATYNHPLKVINERGHLVWKTVNNIKEGDYLVINRKQSFGNAEKNLDEMYALGCLIADGYFGDTKISMTNDDLSVKNFIENNFCYLFDFKKYNKYDNNKKGSYEYSFNDKVAVDNFYTKYGFQQGIAKNKNISAYIRESNKEGLKAFLQGYLDCECSISNEKGLEVTSASYILLYQVKLLLLQFGIIASLHEKNVKNYEENDYWRLNIYGPDFVKYINLIGTQSSARQEQIDEFLIYRESLSYITTNVDSIPNLNLLLEDLYDSFETTRKENKIFGDHKGINSKRNVTYPKLKQIIEVSPKNYYITEYLQNLYDQNYYYDAVTLNEYAGDEPTFDFAMSESHSFIANGIVSHNTSLSLITAAEVQKLGGVAAYLDIENSFNKNWAKTLGVDLDKLIYFQLQPGQGGDVAFDIMETFISSGKVNFIILDSVSALATNAEIQGEYSDAHIGQLARLMSGGLKKINNALAGTNCSVAFINQVRTDIKNYGAFETTSGGKALEFYSSIRLNVKRDSLIGTEKDVQGYVTKIKIVKNKVGTPFRTVLTNLYKNKGIDQNEEIFDTAVGIKLIDKKGGWYALNDKTIGQGKDSAISALIESGEFQAIKQKVVEHVMSNIEAPIEGSFDHVVNRENVQRVPRVPRTPVAEETKE